MTKAILAKRPAFTLGLIFTIYLFLYLLVKSASYDHYQPDIILAISLDLLFTIPLIYMIGIWKSKIPKTTIVPIIILGLILGYFILPDADHNYLDLFKKWLLPIIETFVVLVVTFKMYKLSKAIRDHNSPETIDTYEIIKSSCRDLMPGLAASLMATEIAMIYYLFNFKAIPVLKANEFSYHKKSGTQLLIGVLIFMTIIETFVMHLVIHKWNPTLAWVLTGLSIYATIQFCSFSRSLSRRPIKITPDNLSIKYGLLAEVEIPLSHIDKIELSRKSLSKNKLYQKVSPFGDLESHNIVISLNEEMKLKRLYGLKKSFIKLALHIDEAERFKTVVDKHIKLEKV